MNEGLQIFNLDTIIVYYPPLKEVFYGVHIDNRPLSLLLQLLTSESVLRRLLRRGKDHKRSESPTQGRDAPEDK